MQIRDHFTRTREVETPGDDQAQASIAVRSRTKLIAFMVNRVLTKEQVEHQRELKDLSGNLDYRRESPTVQSYIDVIKRNGRSTKTSKPQYRLRERNCRTY